MSYRTVFEISTTVYPELVESEDSGCAQIVDVVNLDETPDENFIGDGETSFFVRLQSWDDDLKHELMSELVGKKIRVTVEVVEDEV